MAGSIPEDAGAETMTGGDDQRPNAPRRQAAGVPQDVGLPAQNPAVLGSIAIPAILNPQLPGSLLALNFTVVI